MKKNKTTISTIINGRDCDAIVDDNLLLADYLREDLGLFGTKIGCDGGECGCCTVLMDDNPLKACIAPMRRIEGKEIITMEGLDPNKKETVVNAFAMEGGLQCGFCTPGFLVSARAFLNENPKPSEQDIRLAIAVNLCRCTGYDKIVRAIQHVAESSN